MRTSKKRKQEDLFAFLVKNLSNVQDVTCEIITMFCQEQGELTHSGHLVHCCTFTTARNKQSLNLGRNDPHLLTV